MSRAVVTAKDGEAIAHEDLIIVDCLGLGPMVGGQLSLYMIVERNGTMRANRVTYGPDEWKSVLIERSSE